MEDNPEISVSLFLPLSQFSKVWFFYVSLLSCEHNKLTSIHFQSQSLKHYLTVTKQVLTKICYTHENIFFPLFLRPEMSCFLREGLAVQPRLAWNSVQTRLPLNSLRFLCLSLLSAGIDGVGHNNGLR